MVKETAKADFFNALAAKWDEINRYDKDKIELLIKLVNIKPGDAVLDVGTGTGVLLPLLARWTSDSMISAIDIADRMIEAAGEKAAGSGVTFIAGDACTYPFGEKTFDKIICYSVYPHFDDKEATLRNLARSLKENGILAVLHSQSRRKINTVHIHAHHPSLENDHLEPAEFLGALLKELGLVVEICIDTSEMYMVAARKPKVNDFRGAIPY